ncbi:hypothetical protein GGR53DRAFT_483562 [Hypoxylon sp. FL1150]|nr:hypothetical protein GGR53DRAFT_483562 [Hypoxylon sp. FL1150]
MERRVLFIDVGMPGKAPRECFGCSRMDEAYVCWSLQLQNFENFGVRTGSRGIGRPLDLGFQQSWVTDHLGIKAVFNFENAIRI